MCGQGVCVCVYYEIKSTWCQCKRSSSEPVGNLSVGLLTWLTWFVFYCCFIMLPGWVGVWAGCECVYLYFETKSTWCQCKRSSSEPVGCRLVGLLTWLLLC